MSASSYPVPDPAAFVVEPLSLAEAEITELPHLVSTINAYARSLVTGEDLALTMDAA